MAHENADAGSTPGGDGDSGDLLDAAPCGYCATNSGIYDVSARCCKVRLVANMPRRLRLAHYGRLSRDFGADVARDMAEAVKTYHAKRQETEI
jgi:hypothetical protein